MYHTLVQKEWKTTTENKTVSDEPEECIESPFYNIEYVLDYIESIRRIRYKFYDLKSDKFCYIDTIRKNVSLDGTIIYKGIFESARNEFRPYIIDKKTGTKRPNPKTISEGDIEKTHFCIKIDRIGAKEVYVFLERNFYGININNFTNYITTFTDKFLKKAGKKKNFHLVNYQIPSTAFFDELKMLKRTILAEVHFAKQLLGSQSLGFSNRLVSLQKDLVLTAKASRGESITETAVDFYNKLSLKNSPISRIRIKGVDPDNHEVLLDTSLLCKSNLIEIERNAETGEVNSHQLFLALEAIAESF